MEEYTKYYYLGYLPLKQLKETTNGDVYTFAEQLASSMETTKRNYKR